MAAFGENPFPRRFGGGRRPATLERRALERAFKKDGFSVDEGTTKAAEAFALGTAVGGIWSINERLRGAEVPEKMLETLQTYEEVYRTRPSSEDSDNARRSYVAAKMRALAGQATSEDIEDVCQILLGSRFEGLRKLEETYTHTYWPAQNPGRPGLEWCSDRCSFAILVRQKATSDAEWERILTQLFQTMNTLVPAYMTFYIGRDDGGFFPESSLPGLDLPTYV